MKIDSKIIVDEATGIERIDYFDAHWYKIDEDFIFPSVTKVIGDVLSKGFGFEQWLKDVGNESNYIVREAQESGSKLHNAIEMLIKGEIVAAQDQFTKKEWVKLNNWLAWWNGLEISAELLESIVYNIEWGVAGTVDFIGTLNGEKVLIDWKTGNAIHDTGELQVAAYATMYNTMNPDSPITKAYLCHVGALNRTKKDLSNKGVKMQEVDIELLTKQFKNTLDIFKWRFPNAKAPTSEFPVHLKLERGIIVSD